MTEMSEADAKKYIECVADKLSEEEYEKLLKYVMSGKYGTFRYLIYGVLGWDFGGGYWRGMELGLMDLNNSLPEEDDDN